MKVKYVKLIFRGVYSAWDTQLKEGKNKNYVAGGKYEEINSLENISALLLGKTQENYVG